MKKRSRACGGGRGDARHLVDDVTRGWSPEPGVYLVFSTAQRSKLNHHVHCQLVCPPATGPPAVHTCHMHTYQMRTWNICIHIVASITPFRPTYTATEQTTATATTTTTTAVLSSDEEERAAAHLSPRCARVAQLRTTAWAESCGRCCKRHHTIDKFSPPKPHMVNQLRCLFRRPSLKCGGIMVLGRTLAWKCSTLSPTNSKQLRKTSQSRK